MLNLAQFLVSIRRFIYLHIIFHKLDFCEGLQMHINSHACVHVCIREFSWIFLLGTFAFLVFSFMRHMIMIEFWLQKHFLNHKSLSCKHQLALSFIYNFAFLQFRNPKKDPSVKGCNEWQNIDFSRYVLYPFFQKYMFFV